MSNILKKMTENKILFGNYELPQTELIEKRLRNLLYGSYHEKHDYSSFEKDFREIEMHTKNKPRVWQLAYDLHDEISDRIVHKRFKEISIFLENRLSVLSQYNSVKKYIRP